MRTAADPMQTGPTQNDLESTYNADISSSDLLLRQKPYGPVSVRVDQRFLAPRAVSLSVSIHSLCYGDRKVPLCEVESCNHVEGARLRVNLANRERPKWFTFSSAAEAAAFCAVTRRCLDHAAPPHASPRSDKKRAGRGVLGGLRALLREKTTPQDDMLLARTFAFSDESTGGGGSAAARSAASARSRSAAEAAQGPGGFEGCAERHPLELALFGVLLPLLFAGYWLSDAGRDYFDRRGTWLRAACRVWEVETFVSRRYHHGKWAEARNAEYRNGEIFILERAWNVSVVAPTVAHGRANSHWHKIQHTLTGAALDPSARYTRASGRPFRSGCGSLATTAITGAATSYRKGGRSGRRPLTLRTTPRRAPARGVDAGRLLQLRHACRHVGERDRAVHTDLGRDRPRVARGRHGARLPRRGGRGARGGPEPLRRRSELGAAARLQLDDTLLCPRSRRPDGLLHRRGAVELLPRLVHRRGLHLHRRARAVRLAAPSEGRGGSARGLARQHAQHVRGVPRDDVDGLRARRRAETKSNASRAHACVFNARDPGHAKILFQY
uniref:Uncharacterized protein n=1 Tax=Emiliania huxleyi TaxID=2903 RepID=A0A7S3TB79_EMIHU